MYPLSKPVIWILKLYKLCISPFLGNRCKFYPSCSNYAMEAIKKFGVIKGGFYAIIRLAKCGPFTDGGYDPVENIPQKEANIKTKFSNFFSKISFKKLNKVKNKKSGNKKCKC